MKPLVSFIVALAMLGLQGRAQRTDPNSTPPGAPLVEVETGWGNGRMAPLHPGNAGQRVATHTFAVIESQSMNAGHNMDTQWFNLLTSMGHTPTIYPQTALDNLAGISANQALIVSSGTITLTAARINTIQQFLQSGKPVYIQGEYLPTYSTNVAFQNIVNATGGTFSTGSTVAGDLIPCMVLNQYATTPNAVSSIGYHWYGCTGSGCNNIEYFMRYGASNLAFAYCPTNLSWGDMIQNTDQDWIRQGTSLPLMRNIVFAMLSGQACSVVCGTVLDEEDLLAQATWETDGSVRLEWQGTALPGDRFEISCNDRAIGMQAVAATGMQQWDMQDRRAGQGMQRYRIRQLDADGMERRSVTATVDVPAHGPRLRVATEAGGIRLWLPGDEDVAALWLVDLGGRRRALPLDGLQSLDGQWVAMEAMAGGVYVLQAQLGDGRSLATRVLWP